MLEGSFSILLDNKEVLPTQAEACFLESAKNPPTNYPRSSGEYNLLRILAYTAELSLPVYQVSQTD